MTILGFEKQYLGTFPDNSIEENSLEHRWVKYHVYVETDDRSLQGHWSPYDKDSWLPNPEVMWISQVNAFYEKSWRENPVRALGPDAATPQGSSSGMNRPLTKLFSENISLI